MLVSEIADLLGYEIAGDDCDVYGVAWFDFAKEDDIAVINEKEELYHTKTVRGIYYEGSFERLQNSHKVYA